MLSVYVMGRYYSGDIGGKFWFAIQDSWDAEYFGREPEEVYLFHYCSCYAPIDDIGNDKAFCENCFNSFEEHMKECEDTKTWHVSDAEAKFRFEEEDIDDVLSKISELEQSVGKYMESYTIRDSGEIEYIYTLTSDVQKESLPLIARLCLGKQIAYCLEKRGVCTFYAEL